MPGAAILGGGLLATAGIMLRKELGKIVGEALGTLAKRGTAAFDAIDLEGLATKLGLRRHRSALAIAAPGLGRWRGSSQARP